VAQQDRPKDVANLSGVAIPRDLRPHRRPAAAAVMVKSRHHDDLTTNPLGKIYD
jgi:hypothetical protein